ncbi:MAG: phytochelatin synthase family protein [Legionellales bacterium]|jgi:hypothetical protein
MILNKKTNALLLTLSLFLTHCVFAQEPLPSNLLELNSEHGTALLKRSSTPNTTELLQNFTTQQTMMNCGVATAVIVLNSTIIDQAPTDPAYENQYGYDYSYFTQNTFFTDEVLEIITPEQVETNGMTLAQLSDVMNTYGLLTLPVHADDLTLIKFRAIVREALANGQFVTANFLRTGLGQNGGGHHSPIAAYDAATDQFLILDTARYRYASFWVTADDLWDAINTVDNDANDYRGFLIIANPI